MQRELKSLQQRHREWINIVNRGDLEAYAELLTEDAVWFPPDSNPIVGRAAFKQWLVPFFNQFHYDFSVANERFRIAGNRAVEKGKFTSVMTSKEKGDGGSMQHSGTFTILWHRDKNGVWLIERYVDDTNM